MRPELLDQAGGAQDHRARMAAAGCGDADRAVVELQPHARERDEAPGALAQHRRVEPAQDAGRGPVAHDRGADRVAGERGHRGGLGALAAHVAHDREPLALAGREQVVEVAADLVALAARSVQRGRLQASDHRQLGRQQRALERLRDRRARAVQARVLDRGADPQREILGELRRRARERDRPGGSAAHRDRDAASGRDSRARHLDAVEFDHAAVGHVQDREPRHLGQHLLDLEGANERPGRLGQEALRLLGLLDLRDVLDDADREPRLDHRRGLHARPARLAVAHVPDDERLGRALGAESRAAP